MKYIGILTKEEILKYNLISQNIDTENCLKETSYDLRLGNEYIDNEGEYKRLSESNSILKIPPYGSVVVGTFEVVKTRTDVIGRLDLRLIWGYKGLIFQCGTQVEPDYEGRLFGLLFNLSCQEIILEYKKSKLFTIEFHRLHSSVSVTNLDKWMSLTDLVNRYGHKAKSALTAIEAKQHDLKKQIDAEVAKKPKIYALLLAAGVAFFVMVFSVFVPLTFQKSNETFLRETLKTELEKLNELRLTDHYDDMDRILDKHKSRLKSYIDSLLNDSNTNQK